MSDFFQIYDYNKKHKDQYGKVLFWNVSDNKWYLDKAHTKIAKYQEDLSMPQILQTRNDPLYPSTRDADPSTLGIQPFTESNYKPQTWTSKDGMQQYGTTSEGTWIGINFDETNPDHGFAQNWNIETSKWEINGKPSSYQMEPPPILKYEKPKTVNPPTPPTNKTYTNVSGFIKTKKTYVGGSSKPIKEYPKEIKSLPKSYDVLFNSLEYQAIDDALIEKMELSLIQAGDDLLTDFNYESIDYLPDYEIQVKDQSGNYLPIDFSLSDFDDMNTNKEEDEVSHKAEILSSLKAELQEIFGSNKFIRKSKYFGKISAETNKSAYKFSVGVSSGNTIDFRYVLKQEYQNYEINIEFDEI